LRRIAISFEINLLLREFLEKIAHERFDVKPGLDSRQIQVGDLMKRANRFSAASRI
jgi:hypothetical protein